MRQKSEYRPTRAKLPPLLELDEDLIEIPELNTHEGRRWSSDDDELGLEVGEWPTELDD